MPPMMDPINPTYAPVLAFVDELARCGLRRAVTSPGSRNAPLALALAGCDGVEATSVLDERSAGYAAIGMAKASGRPVALTCTSGTAGANLLPAVAEAHEARVPLIVLTADRPPELRDVGAGQAIDQLKLYGGFAKWFCEVGNHPAGRASAIHHRALACRAWATALEGRPGPVHLNFPLREPLAPLRERIDPEPWQGRDGGRPWVRVRSAAPQLEPAVLERLAVAVAGTQRGAIVCGPVHEDVAAAVTELARVAGWPVLAEPTSGVRCGPHPRTHVVSHYDVILRSSAFASAHLPDLVLRVGDTPTSKPLRAWLEVAGRQLVLDPHAAWHEPTREAHTLLVASPRATCERLAEEVGRLTGSVDPGWVESWRRADALVPEALRRTPEPSEPRAYTALAGAAGDDEVVWLSSSMPIRDVESFWPAGPERVRFLANRGANGIDGIVSSALGAALATGRRTYLLTGELALLHDLGGVAALARTRAPLAIVCVANGGGGIFDFLPVSDHAPRDAYEEHLATPVPVPLERVAALAGIPHVLARSAQEVRAAAAEPPVLVEVRSEREQNVALHRDIVAAVDAALAGLRAPRAAPGATG